MLNLHGIIDGKTCTTCGEFKPLEDFARNAFGRGARSSQCKACKNRAYFEKRRHQITPQQKRKWLLWSRYKITPAQFSTMKDAQNGRCGLCGIVPERELFVDHDHVSKRIRGLLCHRCNLIIGGLDDPEFRARAMAWLEWGSRMQPPPRARKRRSSQPGLFDTDVGLVVIVQAPADGGE